MIHQCATVGCDRVIQPDRTHCMICATPPVATRGRHHRGDHAFQTFDTITKLAPGEGATSRGEGPTGWEPFRDGLRYR